MKNIFKLLLLCTIICLGGAIGLNIGTVNAYSYVDEYAATQTTPPDKYDLRDKIHIEVENQHNFGVCFAFASLTSLETYLALNYNEYYDFSEIHFAASLCLKDNYYPTIEKSLKEGGNFNHFVLYTQKDNSLVLEQAMPMDNYLSNSQREKAIKEDYNNIDNNFYSIAKVNDTTSFDVIWGNKSKYSDSELNSFRTKVKNHIMQYGSISASIYSGEGTGSTGDSTYYRVVNDSLATSQNSVRSNVNHMISVVGWNDNYDAGGAWPNKGAYLCLNSWGTTFGDDGYFYISYDDYFVESSMHGVTDATLCTSQDKISTINSYQNKTQFYTHIYPTLSTRYIANIVNVSNHLNQTITSIDNFVIGSNYSVYYNFFNSYSDAISSINSPATRANISSINTGSTYNKLNLTDGINITNNYMLIITRVDNTAEVNSLGGSSLANLNLVPSYNQNKGLSKFDVNKNKWAPDVPNGPADLTIPIILHLNNNMVEVQPIESTYQSIIHEKYTQNNATYINKIFTIKLSTPLTQDIVNAIKIIRLDGNIDITSNFQIVLNSGNVDISLTKVQNINFDDNKNNYLISIPCSNATIYRVINIHDVGQIYNITYHLDDGQANNPDTYTSKHYSIMLNSPTKPGYEFVGWYLDSELTIMFDHNNLPYTDLNLYAKYKIHTPIITQKTSDISTVYNHEYITLNLLSTHPLTNNGYTIKYQWYYAQTASSTLEPIADATNSSFIVKNVEDSGLYACNISLVDESNNVISFIDYTDSQTHIKVNITKPTLTINIDDIISHTELSDTELQSKFSCKIECDHLPENVIEYLDILNYLQLEFTLIDTVNTNVKTISATINDYGIYDVYINPGQYRIVINQLSSNDISTTSENGFTKDCVFNVANYGINDSIQQLLKDKHLNFVDSYDLSYSYLDTSATVYIPLDSKDLLTNIAVYMYKDNQLVRLDINKTTQGISFVTNESDAKYIIVQEKPSKLSNVDFLILINVVILLGTFIVYIVITKRNR